VTQPSDENPLLVDFTVSNTKDRKIRIDPLGPARPLEYIRPFVHISSDAELVPLPQDSELVNSQEPLTNSRINGCWRFVTDAREPTELYPIERAKPITIPPSEDFGIRHSLYHRLDGAECPVVGKYEGEEKLRISYEDQWQKELEAVFVVTLNEDTGYEISSNIKPRE
jgi:hypothetical protein